MDSHGKSMYNKITGQVQKNLARIHSQIERREG